MIRHPDRPTLAEAEADDLFCGPIVIVDPEVRDMVNEWYDEAMQADKIRLTTAEIGV